MKVIAIIGVVLAVLFQAEAASIGISGDMPQVLRETMEQSFSCAIQIGPGVRNIPRISGLDQLPENNPNLNQLWGCIFQKKNIVDSDGNVNADVLHKYLMDQFTIFVDANDEIREMADEVTDTCKQAGGDDYKIKSVKIQNCINRLVREKTGV